MATAEAHVTRRLAAIRKAIENAIDADAAMRGLLELAARWTPDALGTLISQALELAGLEGREAAFADRDEDASFASYEVTRQKFREQIDFLTQKRGKPTKVWTDAMQGDHDRAFVVAGVTDLAMLEEFQAAIIEGARTYDAAAFAQEFDRLVEKYGWSYNGGREWRIRTIFETNIRTSYMAGRLKQMRNAELVKLQPYWQYRHADSRVPMNPRPQHLLWDGLVLDWDDPWWDIHFPPNDWLCSCGVHGLSRGDLRRMGKDGPDRAPGTLRKPHLHKATGETIYLPEGVGYGWDYQPGSLWERGLVPSALIEEGRGLIHEGRHKVIIDEPSPLEDLLARARPFKAQPLEDGLSEEDYVRAFLEPFKASIGRAVLWQDAAGYRVPISDQFFRDRQGNWKLGKRERARLTPLMAEALLDPDEIWIGVAEKKDPVRKEVAELLLDRRYIRADPTTGLIAVMEIGRKWWENTTIYNTTDKGGRPKLELLQNRRGGKLLWPPK